MVCIEAEGMSNLNWEDMMNSRISTFKLVVGALSLGAALLLGGGATANAQGHYDPYYGQGTYGGRDYRRHRKDEKKAEKRHQKEEKEALKRHQRTERDEYGNDADLREHQRQEREELKRHKRDEKNARQRHQRDERGGGYYGNNDDSGYGRENGDYGSGVSQAAFDRGYQEGLRAGQDDRYNNRRYDYQNRSAYRDATAGYNSRYGDRDSYRNSFRGGYQRGYAEGYNRGGSSRRSNGGWGSVLGGIFGRP